jgi:hypothetical protein
VATADDLISLFKHATGNTLQTDIEVTADLDFSSSNLTLPLGAFSNGTCVAFSGVIHGNGHSIKGLRMNNTKNKGYNNSGLFCSLKNATFENLVIDSSCSFTGDSAGALSVSLDGSLTVKHTTNNAAVSGRWRVGGFIGYMQDLKEPTVISFEDCVNNGNVTGSINNVGGFFGFISSNPNMTMINTNLVNNGNITGNDYVGGLVGQISSTNMTISSSANNGIVNGSVYVGGLVGQISSINMTISSSVNNGIVNGSVYVGGFVGYVSTYSSVMPMNSANKGSVSSNKGMACGFVCTTTQNTNVKTTIKNSINKGSVNANTNGYGITNIITEARNVVSMGDVTGPSGSFTFWETTTDVDLFFGLDGKCNNCSDGATLFQHNTSTGFYEVVRTGEHVDDLLNDESVNQHFGMVWTKKLDLVFTVNVSGLWNGTLLAELGTQLNEVGNLSDYFNDEEWCVGDGDSQPRIAFKPTHLVTRNMKVVVGKCMDVTVGAPINKSETMIAGETLDHLAFFFHFSLDDFIVVAKGSDQVLNQLSVIETHTVLKLCHNVSVLNASESRGFLVEHQQPLQTNTDLVEWADGYHLAQSNQNNKTELLLAHFVEDDLDLVLCSLVTTTSVINTTFLVESGTKLGQISDLDKYFNPPFIIYDNNDTNTVLTRDTVVSNDIIVVITEVSKVDVVIIFDENKNITVEEVESAIKDLVELPEDEHLWIEVISQGDNSFVISIRQTGDEQTDVANSLRECSLSK